MIADLPKEWGVVQVHRPPGCTRTELSLSALDEHTRSLARGTFIEFNGRLISCIAFAVKDGNLVLTIPAGCYRFMGAEDTQEEIYA